MIDTGGDGDDEGSYGDALAVRLPERAIMQICYDIFFERHFSTTFCCFLYRPDLESHALDAPFLSTAILCLCSKYFTREQAKEHFGLESGLEITRLYTPVARALARATSDEPTGMLYSTVNLQV